MEKWHLWALKWTRSWPADPSCLSTSVGTPSTRRAWTDGNIPMCASPTHIRGRNTPGLCNCDYICPRVQGVAISPCRVQSSISDCYKQSIWKAVPHQALSAQQRRKRKRDQTKEEIWPERWKVDRFTWKMNKIQLLQISESLLFYLVLPAELLWPENLKLYIILVMTRNADAWHFLNISDDHRISLQLKET